MAGAYRLGWTDVPACPAEPPPGTSATLPPSTGTRCPASFAVPPPPPLLLLLGLQALARFAVRTVLPTLESAYWQAEDAELAEEQRQLQQGQQPAAGARSQDARLMNLYVQQGATLQHVGCSKGAALS